MKLERRTARLRKIKERLSSNTTICPEDEEQLLHSNPSDHYHISASRKFHFNITNFLAENKGDVATKVRCL